MLIFIGVASLVRVQGFLANYIFGFFLGGSVNSCTVLTKWLICFFFGVNIFMRVRIILALLFFLTVNYTFFKYLIDQLCIESKIV